MRWRALRLLGSVALLATAGCGEVHEVEREYPEIFDEPTTGNRYLEATLPLLLRS